MLSDTGVMPSKIQPSFLHHKNLVKLKKQTTYALLRPVPCTPTFERTAKLPTRFPAEPATILPRSGPRKWAMRRTIFRARVIREAHRDAAAFFRECRCAVGPAGMHWVTEAWADVRSDFKLPPEKADRLWPVYWKAFDEETVRLASSSGQ